MNHLRPYGALLLAVVLCIVGPALFMPLPVSAAAPPSTVPEPIAVPAGYELLFVNRARGVQTYECQSGQWAFRAPIAVLVDPQSDQLTAIHYGGIDRGLTAGPWWESVHDGSRIRGGNAVSAPSPNPNSIPLLRLEVLEKQGAGMFSPAAYIQRLNTVGGVGPTGACKPGAKRWVPYTADYHFFGRP